MIPLRDENPIRTFPWVTLLLIGTNIAVFLYEFTLSPRALEMFVLRYGAVPAAVFAGSRFLPAPSTLPYLTLVTSMFLHGGILHLAGNMLYLWIFGDNVEDRMGPPRFLLFYLICGVAAALIQIAARPQSTAPLVGASGAIAGVLGAYALLFPGARVQTLIFLFIFVRLIELPALFVLGAWFLMQLLSAPSSQGSGVAFFAHIGGFLSGMILMAGFLRRRRTRG
jgi:rhomboid family protein